jgi:hypothetical protein
MKAGQRYSLRLTLGLILQLREEEAITWKSTRTRYGYFQNKRKSIFRQLYHKQEKKQSALRVNLTCGTQEKEEGNK